MKEIDARGLACPAPVLRAKEAVESPEGNALRVVVDNAAAQQNVQRFLENSGFEVRLETLGADLIVTGSRDGAPVATSEPAPAQDAAAASKIMVFAPTDRIGFGDDELGKKLMVNFLGTLKEMGDALWRLVLVNNGVKLAVDGSPALDALSALEARGVMILVCGTCLTHFDLLEKKRVGITTNMLDIVTAMQLADKVINV